MHPSSLPSAPQEHCTAQDPQILGFLPSRWLEMTQEAPEILSVFHSEMSLWPSLRKMSEFSLHGKFQNVIFVVVLNSTIFNFQRIGTSVSALALVSTHSSFYRNLALLTYCLKFNDFPKLMRESEVKHTIPTFMLKKLSTPHTSFSE